MPLSLKRRVRNRLSFFKISVRLLERIAFNIVNAHNHVLTDVTLKMCLLALSAIETSMSNRPEAINHAFQNVEYQEAEMIQGRPLNSSIP